MSSPLFESPETLANSSTNFIITTLPRSYILAHPTTINTNNILYASLPPSLAALESPTPSSSAIYQHAIALTSYSRFRPLIISLSSSTTIPPRSLLLTHRICTLLASSLKAFILTGTPSSLDAEEINDKLLPLLEPYFIGTNKNAKWFIRLDEASPKDSRFKTGPYTSAEQVILALTTSLRVFRAVLRISEEEAETSKGTVLHFLPFREDVSTDHEFRCFIPPVRFNGGVCRAVSQYSGRDVGWDPRQRRTWDCFEKILEYIPSVFFSKAEELGVQLPRDEGFVLDLHVTEGEDGDWKIEPLEINSFGAQLASGSSVFSWAVDWKRMYGLEEDWLAEFRIVFGDAEGEEGYDDEVFREKKIYGELSLEKEEVGSLPVETWRERAL